jgi:hypothetical protein
MAVRAVLGAVRMLACEERQRREAYSGQRLRMLQTVCLAPCLFSNQHTPTTKTDLTHLRSAS